MFRLFAAIDNARKVRAGGMRRGEALAWHYREAGYERAIDASARTETQAEWIHAIWIARFARRRLDELDGNDLASKYEIGAKWRRRRGSWIDQNRTIEELVGSNSVFDEHRSEGRGST